LFIAVVAPLVADFSVTADDEESDVDTDDIKLDISDM